MESIDKIPIFGSIKDIYSDPSIQKDKKQKLESSIAKFKEEFGTEPEHFARAPGRVNIIGEHIDYNGYGVLPFALHMEIWFFFGPSELPRIRMTNTNSTRFAPKDYPLLTSQWVVSPGEWSGYVIWGFRSILFLMNSKKLPIPVVNGQQSLGRGLNLLVFSDLPIACGVSSSSALSVGSALVLSKMLDVEASLDRTELVSKIIEFECENGILGGGMDQTISTFGQTGHCLAIEFKPALRSTPVEMKGLCMVLCNSLTESVKVETGHKQYNKRVFECKMGLIAMIKQALGADADIAQFATLWDLQTHLKLDLDGMDGLLEKALGNTKGRDWKLNEVYSCVGISDYKAAFGDDDLIKMVTEKNEHFRLYDRIKHVIDESRRVGQYIATLGRSDDPRRLERLGELMTESHQSCAELYECSSVNLDYLTKKSLECGALGSRLTGAGWGGCYINLVPAEQVKRARDDGGCAWE